MNKLLGDWDFTDRPVVKFSPSNAVSDCNKFNKDFLNGLHQNNL